MRILIKLFTYRHCPSWLVLLALLLCACSQHNGKKAFTIAFSQCTGADMWRRTMLNEMRTELSLHSQANFLYTDARGNSDRQIKQVKRLLAQKPDLLIISPNEAAPLTPVVDEAYRAGIPVIVIDRKTVSDAYTAYVGADNYQIGYMAASYVAATAKQPINVLQISGLAGSSPAIERQRGFYKAAQASGKINIIQTISGNWLAPITRKRLLANPALVKQINTVFAHNDVMAQAAHQVLQQAGLGKKIKVIGVDALPVQGGGLDMVDRKTLSASLVYPTGGKEAIATAFRILNHEPFERENILQSLVVDSSNVQLMKMQLHKINDQQGDIARQQALLAEQSVLYKSQQSVLNFIIVSLILAVIGGGLAFYWLMEFKKVNKSLEHKNDEIISQRNQLIEMSARAESASEARLNFFTNVSHEFRTPLTLITSSVQDILTDEKAPRAFTKSAQTIQKNTFRLLKLINELIDFRKIEVDKQTIRARELNLVNYLRDIADSFKPHAQKMGIALQFTTASSHIPVWFDAPLLDKVFFNLLANAIKFSQPGGTVSINIADTYADDHVKITITDTGCGMTDDELAFIFDQYYQADNAPVAGSGIGLALARQVVQLHHGQIQVQSKKWAGTTFTVTLPLGCQHLTESEKQAGTPEQPADETLIQLYQPQPQYNQPAGYQFTPQHSASVLIIEDDADLLQYLTEKLNPYFEVFTAAHGTAALTEAYEKVPDLIVSDVVLPGLSGKEIAATLKKDIRTSHIPVILLTAQSTTDQQISGLNAMADMYVTKPFDFNYLHTAINNLLQNRSLLKEHFISGVPQKENSGLKPIDKKFINDFKGIIELNLANEKFNVDDVCRAIGISRVQLYRKVKALMDCSVADYITARRLKKAQYLLQNEQHTIAEITYMVGFSTPAYFSSVFKNKYGITPTHYKKQFNN